MKYLYNPVTNDLDEIDKIPDLEDKLEKGIEGKEARESGWKDNKELTQDRKVLGKLMLNKAKKKTR